jgi:hypothetical protein
MKSYTLNAGLGRTMIPGVGWVSPGQVIHGSYGHLPQLLTEVMPSPVQAASARQPRMITEQMPVPAVAPPSVEPLVEQDEKPAEKPEDAQADTRKKRK